MSDAITISKDTAQLALVMFAMGGMIFGFIAGRICQAMAPDQPRRRRRKPAERHTRSHW